jgi:hypothetical protein
VRHLLSHRIPCRDARSGRELGWLLPADAVHCLIVEVVHYAYGADRGYAVLRSRGDRPCGSGRRASCGQARIEGAARGGSVTERPDMKWSPPGRCGSCGDLRRRRRYEDLLGGSR